MKIKISKLDKIFSQYIRTRALKRVQGCERCLKYKTIGQLQTSHFHGRRCQSVRFDESNAAGLCFSCHQHLGENPLEHTEWFKKHIGEEEFENLRIRAMLLCKPDLAALELYFKAKLKELDEQGE